MAPPPSPNACGLAAYEQVARNLTITDSDHPYWTSRRSQADRFALWLRWRSFAAPYLKELGKSGESFDRECAKLREIVKIFPPKADEALYLDPRVLEKVSSLLSDASREYAAGIRGLGEAPALPSDADALEKLVGDEDTIVAESALAKLVAKKPSDLDVRLARLFDALPDRAKKGADGPIHRQILWALDKLPERVATDAIGRAIFFEGKSDAMPGAVSNWAARMYWRRVGKEGRAVWLQALDAKRESVLEFIGGLGDRSLLERLKPFEHPGACYSRILLGDESAYAPLVEKFAERYVGRRLLCEIGAPAERHLIPYLDSKLAPAVAEILSRIGGEASIAALEKKPELAAALKKLRARLGGK